MLIFKLIHVSKRAPDNAYLRLCTVSTLLQVMALYVICIRENAFEHICKIYIFYFVQASVCWKSATFMNSLDLLGTTNHKGRFM